MHPCHSSCTSNARRRDAGIELGEAVTGAKLKLTKDGTKISSLNLDDPNDPRNVYICRRYMHMIEGEKRPLGVVRASRASSSCGYFLVFGDVMRLNWYRPKVRVWESRPSNRYNTRLSRK